MRSRVTVAPPVEPLTLAQVKLNRAIDHDLHDDLLTALITAAREYVEQHCEISIITQTREATADAFDTDLELPFGPVQSVTAVEYVATDGTVTAIDSDDYQADLYSMVGRVAAAYNSYWPTDNQVAYNAVRVRYVAGFAPAAGSPTDYRANVPQAIRAAMQLLIGNWYENREASTAATLYEVPLGVNALLMGYRLRKGMA